MSIPTLFLRIRYRCIIINCSASTSVNSTGKTVKIECKTQKPRIVQSAVGILFPHGVVEKTLRGAELSYTMAAACLPDFRKDFDNKYCAYGLKECDVANATHHLQKESGAKNCFNPFLLVHMPL